MSNHLNSELICSYCDYKTIRKSDYIKHLATKKHRKKHEQKHEQQNEQMLVFPRVLQTKMNKQNEQTKMNNKFWGHQSNESNQK